MNQVNHIVLFDGVCNLCNSSVQFLIKQDKKGVLKYASLQSDIGKQLMEKHDIDEGYMDSIVFLSEDKVYVKSTAVLQIAGFLNTPVNWLKAFILIPGFIRNPIYEWIAKNRYKWFGKEDQCMVPNQEISARFL